MIISSGQIITTSAEVTLNGGLVRESSQNPLNSGLGIILICPDFISRMTKNGNHVMSCWVLFTLPLTALLLLCKASYMPPKSPMLKPQLLDLKGQGRLNISSFLHEVTWGPVKKWPNINKFHWGLCHSFFSGVITTLLMSLFFFPTLS